MSMKKIVLRTACVFGIVSILVAPFSAHANSLSNITYVVSSATASAAANHTISFVATSGVSSGQRIKLDLANLISSTGSVDYTDIDLSYSGTDATLASAAGVSVWGVAVDSSLKTVTFSFPSSGTAVAAGATVTIEIGTHATFQSTGTRQLVTASTFVCQNDNTKWCGKPVWLAAGNDVSLTNVMLVGATGSVPEPPPAVPPVAKQESPPKEPDPVTEPKEEKPAAQETRSAPQAPQPAASGSVIERVVSRFVPPPPVQPLPALALIADEPSVKEEVETPEKDDRTAPLSIRLAAPQRVVIPTNESRRITVTREDGMGLDIVVPRQSSEFLRGEAPSGAKLATATLAGIDIDLAQKTPPSAFEAKASMYTFDIKNVSIQQARSWSGVRIPSEKRAVKAHVYLITAYDQAGNAITRFENPLFYTITFRADELEDIDAATLRAFSWDPVSGTLAAEKSTLSKNAVSGNLSHLTYLLVLGDPRIEGAQPADRQSRSVAVTPAASLQGVQTAIMPSDVQLTSDVTGKRIGLNSNNEFYAPARTPYEVCISKTVFPKTVKAVAVLLGSDRSALEWDERRSCYRGKVSMPDEKGKTPLTLRIVYADDQVAQVRFFASVTGGALQADILSTVGPALEQAKATGAAINTAVAAAVVTSEPVLQSTVAVAVPVAAFTHPAIIANTLQWYHYANHFFSIFLTVLGIRKRRRPWGVVYDAISKNPVDLAIVRLISTQSKKLVETQVTDKAGRFSFYAQPGTYELSVSKAPFHFPSEIVTGSRDDAYADVYRGDSFEITHPDQILNMSIPLDPPNPGAFHSPLRRAFASLQRSTRFLIMGSLVISGVLTVYTPSALNTTLLILGAALFVGQYILSSRIEKPWGVVFDALTLEPIPLAAISIFQSPDNKLLRTRLSDYHGRFSFLTPPGSYILRAAKDRYAFPPAERPKKKNAYMGEVVTLKKKNTMLKINVPLQPLSGEPSDASSPIVQSVEPASLSQNYSDAASLAPPPGLPDSDNRMTTQQPDSPATQEAQQSA